MLQKSKIQGMLTIGAVEKISGSDVQEKIEEMMNNLAISTPILRITRDILAKTISVYDIEKQEIDVEKTNRFLRVVGFEGYVKDLSFNIFGEFSVHEKVYEVPEGGSLQLGSLIRLPNDYVKFDMENFKSTMGWYYEDNDGNEKPIKVEDFAVSVFGYTIDNPMGYGMFRYGVIQAWTDLDSIESQIRSLQVKYGSTIPIFGYDPVEAETEEGLERLQKRVDGIRQMSSGNESVIGIPLSGRGATLKDGFQTISLKDLKIDMHITLKNKLEESLETFLMGARFSKKDSGSNAKEQVQADQKDKMMNQVTKFIVTQMNKLLVEDAELFGYESENFTFTLEEFLTSSQKIEKKSKELTLAKQEMDNANDNCHVILVSLNAIADMKFKGIDDNTIADLLDMDIAIVTQIAPKEMENVNFVSTNPLPMVTE